MFTLGIPNRQYRRTTQVLGPELANPISYKAHKQDDGFYMFSFPDIDEYDFKDIVLLLKNNGITTIGADKTLTEKNIMKLTNLLKEQPSPDENNLIDILKDRLERMEDPQYRGGIEGCEKSNHFLEEIREMIEDYEEGMGMDAIAMGADDVRDMQEQNTRSGEFDVEVSVQDKKEKVKVKYGHVTGPVDEVTISWGNESHTVDFEQTDENYGDSKAYDEAETWIYEAYSEDDMWKFMVEVLKDPNEDADKIWEVEWNTLEIKMNDAKKDPMMERLQKLAGLKNK